MAAPVVSPAEFQRQQAATAQGVLLLVRRQWDQLKSLDDWERFENRITILTASGQAQAARRAAEHTIDTLATRAVGAVDPTAFSGVASDGRALNTYLRSAVIHARSTYTDPLEQLASGRQWLSMLAHTAVADAGRGAAQVQIAATPQAGYIRVVSPPCCQRCAVLAGKTFKWNEGFERHPQCDCTHQPYLPGSIPDGASIGPDDVKDLTIAQRKAIGDGADMNAVINSHRKGARSIDKMTTSEGTTRRGWASYVRREVAKQRGEIAAETAVNTGRRGRVENYVVRRVTPRLTPEAIYREAVDRREAVRLLALNGYITGPLADVARLAQ